MRIAIAGCGPGGLASALSLKQAGHDVTIYDQFAAPRALGSGLLIQPSGQAILAQLGLLDAIRTCAAPVTRLSGINVETGKRALDMEYRHLGADAHALGIHRASLFDQLFAAVNAHGIAVHTDCRLVSATASEADVLIKFENGRSAGPFDLLIDATGAHGPLATGTPTLLPFAALWTTVDQPKNSNIAVDALDQCYRGASKMAGIMPVGINPATGNPGAALFWSIKPGDFGVLQAKGLSAWRDEFLHIWPEASGFVDQITTLDAFTLAIYAHRTGRPVSNGRIFHIGDSWHCTSPQLGQGANMALMDAAAIATAFETSGNVDEIGRHYCYLRSDHVHLYQALSAVFTPLYQSDSRVLPMLRDFTIHHGARLPLVRTLIAKVVSGNLGKFS
jgi:salicylate hydroxylase